jgi:cytochrome c peroxidase
MRLNFLIAIIIATAMASSFAWAENTTISLPNPLTDDDFPAFPDNEVELGQLLFWDKALSGNDNIACASCHHPRFGTSDGLSLGVGEGGVGLGPDRTLDPENYPEQRIPRNSPALWNVGANDYTVLFADGRIETDPSRRTGFRTPLEDEMVSGFASLLSAQTMFPVLSGDEMAGHYHENDISMLVRQGRLTGDDGAWAAIAAKIAEIPEYQQRFETVYPEIRAGRPVRFTDISNAIAAFMTVAFRSTDAPFDQMLRNEISFEGAQLRGMELFYGDGQCSSCHAGSILSDMNFHAMGEPQLGPGKTERFESHQRDIGRMRVTNNSEDAYAFRTPSLRNVTLTAPYGHSGAYSDLEDYLRHHVAADSLNGYSINHATLPEMNVVKSDLNPSSGAGSNFEAISAAAYQFNRDFTEEDISDLLQFLATLEDPIAKNGGHIGIPDSVPSGIPIDR